MLQAEQIEELVTLVSTMDRQTLEQQFRAYPARFPIDFTPEFFANTPLERLRHIFLALCLQTQQMPTLESIPAAA